MLESNADDGELMSVVSSCSCRVSLSLVGETCGFLTNCALVIVMRFRMSKYLYKKRFHVRQQESENNDLSST